MKIASNETNLNKIPIDFYVKKKLCALDQQSFKQLHAAYVYVKWKSVSELISYNIQRAFNLELSSYGQNFYLSDAWK